MNCNRKMNDNTLNAKSVFEETEATLVFYKNGEIFTDKERGVKTLLQFADSGRLFHGYSVADKVVGKAAAYLYVILGIDEIYAEIISKEALNVLEKYGIRVFFKEKVDRIINRNKTGFCPMEEAVLGIQIPADALIAIREKFLLLNG